MIKSENNLSFFDCNAFIGKHNNPYNASPFTSDMLEQSIINSSIKSSLVHHSASVYYDAFYGNKILIEEIKGKSFAANLCWVVVPEMCNSEKEAESFYDQMKQYKISAIKIFPRYHYFILRSGSLDNLFNILNKNHIPLLISQEETSWDEILYILDTFKNLPFILLNSWYRMERYISPLLRKYKNFNLDISRYQTHGGIEYLCSNYGSERLLFGSSTPIFSPESVMMMIAHADISHTEKENIAGKNLMRLLNCDQ
jgi:predicted TIM-barrel fold metal-dependent hydrolase